MYFHRMISHLQRSLLNFTSHIQSHYVRVTLLSSTFCSYYSTSSLVHIPFLTILVSLQFISTLTKPTKIESSTDVNNRHKIDETHGIFLICVLNGCRHKSYPLTHGTQRHYIFNGSSFFGRSLVFNYPRNQKKKSHTHTNTHDVSGRSTKTTNMSTKQMTARKKNHLKKFAEHSRTHAR